MVTRPGYIYGGPTDGWVSIGQDAAVSPFKYQATAPTSPATGDIWIDSSSTVNSIDSTQLLRWRKTMVGGETSLSGNDDASLPLTYTPGYEQLYINGVLQVRGVDYTATTGSTITALTALVANDVVEIFSAVARAVSDVYTQSQSDARFVNKSVGGLNLVIPTSVTGGTVSTNGQIALSSATTVTIDGVFSSSYANYLIIASTNTTSTGSLNSIQLRSGGSTTAGSGYFSSHFYHDLSTTGIVNATNGGSAWALRSVAPSAYSITLLNPFAATPTMATGTYIAPASTLNSTGTFGAHHNGNTSFDGLVFNCTSATGTIRIYGYNNGA